jgi:TRAP-type C4-dicarboxylate transport system permease small subunit
MKHIGVTTGAAMAAVGLVVAVASLAGFSLGLPAVQPATALSASWFMVAVVLMFVGAFVALVARGVELEAEDRRRVHVLRPVRQLHPTR